MDRLCAGTFFKLLSDSKCAQPTYHDRYAGIAGNVSDSNLYIALGKVVRRNMPDSFQGLRDTIKTQARNLKACKTYGGPVCNFRDPIVRSSFQEDLLHDYRTSLFLMCELVSTFLDTDPELKKDLRLVKALLALIQQDSEIPNAQLFYIFEDGTSCTKAELNTLAEITVQPFLLGVWEYALCHVDVKVGADTYARWQEAEGTYLNDLATACASDISLKYCASPALPSNTSPVGDDRSANLGETAIVDGDPVKDASMLNGNAPASGAGDDATSDTVVPGINSLSPSTTINMYDHSPTISINVSGNVSIGTAGSPRAVLPKAKQDQVYVDNNAEYYNLFCGYLPDDFHFTDYYCKMSFSVPRQRCLTIYTDPDLASILSSLSDESIAFLKSLPCIFADENARDKEELSSQQAYLGAITRILPQRKEVRFECEIYNPVPQSDLNRLHDELGIEQNYWSELATSHWTVKRIPLPETLRNHGILEFFF